MKLCRRKGKNAYLNQDDDLEVTAVLHEFVDVFRDELHPGLPLEPTVDHVIKIDPNEKPPHRPIFQQSPAELLATKQYVIDLSRKGKIRPSRTPIGAPLVFVRQKGKLRVVIDYRALNRITKPKHTPIPRLDNIFDRSGRARFFSKLDLKSGFHLIRVAPEDIEKTAFNTKYRHFEFLVMSLSLRNSPAGFQSLMNKIFYDHIDDFLVIYLENILIYSNSHGEHLRNLRTVLERLRQHELYIRMEKAEIVATETEFLGQMVRWDGIKIGEERLKLVQKWPKPSNISELEDS